ncbi:unnamed protein product [Sphagnum jensenii]|jgi:hypothetical protein|uniref:Uncharacterized protein n=1 Tax=Sphagnum jensenii TaxID=128206 RepID=A0ABP0VQF0_9BRYO
MPYRHQSKHPKLQNCANIGHTYVAGRWNGQFTQKTKEAGGPQLRYDLTNKDRQNRSLRHANEKKSPLFNVRSQFAESAATSPLGVLATKDSQKENI